MHEPKERTSRSRSQKWLRCPRPNPDAGLRLVCLPYSGGRASVFNNLATDLPCHLELWAVEYPGHGRRLPEAPCTRLAPLVEQIADVLAHQVRRPFALLGYSVGALIGFEVARALARAGQPGPAALFAAAAKAPHLRPARPPLHELSREELIEGLHRLAGVRNELLDNEELVDVMLPVLRADLSLDETYAYDPGAVLDCPVVAFGGSEDWSTPRSSLEAWREQTAGGFSLVTLPGGHFFLDSSRIQFARALTAEIERLTVSREGDPTP